MSPEGKCPKQFNPEQKKSVLSSAETADRLTKELFLPKTLLYMKSVIRKLSPNIQEADRDDVVQETLIVMNRSIKNGNFNENKGKLNTYLFKVIRSKLADLYEKKQKHSNLDLDKFKITDPKTPTEDWIEKAYMADMVSQLPTVAKKAMELMLRGHDYTHIGKELGITNIRVAKIIFGAKQKLKKIIAEDTKKINYRG